MKVARGIFQNIEQTWRFVVCYGKFNMKLPIDPMNKTFTTG